MPIFAAQKVPIPLKQGIEIARLFLLIKLMLRL
jgi:hypothetical protein